MLLKPAGRNRQRWFIRNYMADKWLTNVCTTHTPESVFAMNVLAPRVVPPVERGELPPAYSGPSASQVHTVTQPPPRR